MPVIDQMPCRLDRRFVVVGDGGIGKQPGWRPADEHQWRTLLALHMKVTLIFSDRAQDQPVDAPTGEGIDHGAFAMSIIVGTGRENCRVSAVGYGLDSTIDRG